MKNGRRIIKKEKQEIPVSQRELAVYLGISASMMHMARSGKYVYHSLSFPLLKKLAGLIMAQEEVQKTGQTGHSFQLVQDKVNTDIAETIATLEMDASYLESKAPISQAKLEAMINREREDRDWLNTVDHLLANIPDTKDKDKDRRWLEIQQTTVSARLKKNGKLAQVKVQLQIEVDKARAKACREAVERLAAS